MSQLHEAALHEGAAARVYTVLETVWRNLTGNCRQDPTCMPDLRCRGARLDLGGAGAGSRDAALRIRRVRIHAPDAGVPLRSEGVVDGLAARRELRSG